MTDVAAAQRRCASQPCAEPPLTGHDRCAGHEATLARVRADVAGGWRAGLRKCVARDRARRGR